MSDLAERVDRVRLLLETLDDYLPPPAISLRPDSGPAASRFVPCETCKERGQLKVRGRLVLCLVCDGAGWHRRRDEPAWDAYLELPLDEAMELRVEPATT